ncbi:M28 family metallopeptidase [Nonomuraea sp. NBC_01738]|uniref:M28 family metallopeptidase n=1 Tax=Nonomuraea sp. NBC_01738 TaxID=2976003 RepID=UPI002E12BFDA|nr:M28 family metallopeptidase [Nonomuraea sp. NBC_01738]
MHFRLIRRAVLGAGAALVLAVPLAAPAQAAPVSPGDVYSKLLTSLVKPRGVEKHLKALQAIADANGGTRALDTPGYAASRDYVAGKMKAAGYKVTIQEFPLLDTFTPLAPPLLEQTAPDQKVYVPNTDVVYQQGTVSGEATAQVQAVDLQIPPGPVANSSTSGCQEADFAGFVAGRIALIQRGTCPYYVKIRNAKKAGAVAVVVFNEGQPGRTGVTGASVSYPDASVAIPVVFASFATGADLADPAGTTVHVKTSAETTTVITQNVIADSRFGRPDKIVMSGSHLDSVPGGPGLNDNGSGSATVLETALQAKLFPTLNRTRYAWWGAEEFGLLGSTYYVNALPEAERAKIALYLNFDMVGSPNYAYKVYDGDDSDAVGSPAGPAGSDDIEKTFEAFFAKKGLATVGTDFDGRSDYGPFITNGIPAGGLFTGAEGIKTADEAAKFGGQAGVAYDVCYHQACDSIANVDMTAIDVNADAIADSVARYAWDADLPGPALTARSAGAAPANSMAEAVG